jgi:alkylation response protein AidB-like acyl-CoA dehydrogenase
MDFRLPPQAGAVRAEVREFLDGFLTEEREERYYRTGVSHDPDYVAAILERGWMAPSWPEEWGGGGLTGFALTAMGEELGYADAPTYSSGVTMQVARLVRSLGSEELKQEVLPRALRGEIICSLGFTEPGCGSDVANAQTRAVRDGDEWVVNGQKMFTTNAHIADYVLCLVRTDPAVAKHEGLTVLLVPTDQPGFEAQAVYTLSGERTNITFYADVRVPDRYRIGDVDGGWHVMTHALQDEHTAGFGPKLLRLVHDTEAWARESGRIDEPDARARLARAAAEAEVALLMQHRNTWMVEQGEVPVVEGPMTKLLSSEALERAAQDLHDLVGPDALRGYFEPTAPVGGRIEHALRFSLGTTIYAGTSEVQRNIIAQRGLGLPR